MESRGATLKRILPVLPLLAIGVALAVLLMRDTSKVQATAPGDPGRVVRYIIAETEDLHAELRGYGNVKPATIWTAVAQVTGTVLKKHPQLETGQPLARGAVLLSIDDNDYKLALKQHEAVRAQAKQALSQLDQQQENLRRDAEIIAEQLRIAEAELERAEDAFSRQAASRHDVDTREQQVLTHRSQLQTNENAIDLIQPRRAEQLAVLEAADAAIEKAKLDIERCTIRAPFNARVRLVDVEEGQSVLLGEEMFELFGVEAAELHCQVTLDDLKPWLPDELMSPLEADMLSRPWETSEGPIRGAVILAATEQDVRWEGHLDRFLGELDPFTRMLTVVIRVEDPYSDLGRAERPPLVEGMFCEGVLYGRLHDNVVSVPARAVHDGRVYLMNAAGELEIRPVSVRFRQGEYAIVDQGLKGGERIVVSDVYPAVAGMKLRGERAVGQQLVEVQP